MLRPATRSSIRSEVMSIQPLDALELAHQDVVLAWIDSGAILHRTMKPDVPPQHLVSYAVVVDGDSILLVDHIASGLWLPTGGHVVEDEHPRDAARRELTEELGIATSDEIGAPLLLTVTDTVGPTAGHVDVSLWYAIEHNRSAPIEFAESEFTAAQWFPMDGLPLGRTDPHVTRFVRKLAALRATPSYSAPRID